MRTKKKIYVQVICILLAFIFSISTPLQILASESKSNVYEGKNDYKPQEQKELSEEEMNRLLGQLKAEYQATPVAPIETEPSEEYMAEEEEE